MARSVENRSLDRGLAILDSMSIHGASSLQDLHARTRLPKTTIRRLLGTLIRRKIVRRSLSDQLYRANISLPLRNSPEFAHGEGWLVERAVPHMIELTRSVGWSCDLHIFERTRSRIIESTRPLSPFFQYKRQIDLEVPVFASAGGLAVLKAAVKRFSQRRTLAYAYASALVEAKRHEDAADFLAEQLHLFPRDDRLLELRAKTYAALGKRLLQHQTQAEVYVQRGSLHAAIEQLQLARAAGDGDFYQLSVIDARLRELRAQLVEEAKAEKQK